VSLPLRKIAIPSDRKLIEELSKQGSVCSCKEEGVLSVFGIKEAACGVEFSKIESENQPRLFSLGLGAEFVTRCVASTKHDHGFKSSDLIRRTPFPKPGYYMDSLSA
jgi:hypothetical protein